MCSSHSDECRRGWWWCGAENRKIKKYPRMASCVQTFDCTVALNSTSPQWCNTKPKKQNKNGAFIQSQRCLNQVSCYTAAFSKFEFFLFLIEICHIYSGCHSFAFARLNSHGRRVKPVLKVSNSQRSEDFLFFISEKLCFPFRDFDTTQRRENNIQTHLFLIKQPTVPALEV